MRGFAGSAALLLLAGALGGCAPLAPVASPAAAVETAPAAVSEPATARHPIALSPLEHHGEPPAAPPESTVAPVVSDTSGDASEEAGTAGVEFQRGGASWYGTRFQGRRTASGERFDLADFTAAHRTLPFGTLVCVRSLLNDRQVLVRVNDRGPAARSRVIDLSQAAAENLAMVGMGVQAVALSRPLPGQLRCQ